MATKKTTRTIKTAKLTREGMIIPRERAEGQEDDRVRELSFASEEPYERSFGVEILDHGPGAGNLTRLNNAGPLLLFHDTTKPIGVIEKAWIDEGSRQSRALVRFGKSAAASEALQDVDDGILNHVSFAYWPKKMEDQKSKDGPKVYRVTDWEALEISLVTVAADDTVGVGRDVDDGEEITVEITEELEMEDKTVETKAAEVAVPRVEVKDVRDEATETERKRVRAIRDYTAVSRDVIKNADEIADTAINEGRSVEEFMTNLRVLGVRTKPSGDNQATIGTTEKETKRYDLLRAIRAYSNPSDKRLWEAAAFERECSDAVSDRLGKNPSTFFVPNEVLGRTLTSGGDGTGSQLVGTDHRGQDFIDVLRARMLCTAMGAQVLSGLQGSVAIPAMTAGATGSWVAEGNAASETTQTTAQITLSPKTVTAWSEITDTLAKQSSPDAGNMVMNDLASALAVAMDKAGLHGAGTNEPTGIASTSGIGSVVGGTHGLAPALTHLVKLEEQVAIDNADIGALGYMTNPKVRRKLKETPVVASTDSRMLWGSGDMPVNGYRCGITNQVSSTLTKGDSVGVCSAIFYGNWADLVFGVWGALDILVDPYSQSTTRKTRLVAGLTCDVAVRRAVSFAAMLDALTT